MLLIIFWLLVWLVLTNLTITGIANAITFPRLRRDTTPVHPHVSILIPARNEAAVISATVRSVLTQTYRNFELLILDDASTDDTAAIARHAAAGDARLHLHTGKPLPHGWLGKNWACHQLAEAADPRSELLIFIDADVRLDPAALSALVSAQQRHSAGLLAIWPTQITRTWAERLVIPMMSLVISAYLPEVMVRFSPFAAFSAANGQCLVFRRDTYAATGGHAAVRDQIVEDVVLAQRTKRAGHSLVMIDGNHLVACRMYENWAGVLNGYAKNILAGHGNSLAFLAVSTVVHLSMYVLPWVWLLLGGWLPLGPNWPLFPLVLIAQAVLLRMLSAATTHQRLLDSVFMPVSALLMTRIAAQSAWWQLRFGGPQWKGRQIITRP